MSEVVGIEVSFSGVDGEGSCLRDRTSHGTRLSAVPYETPCYFEFLAGGEGIGVARARATGALRSDPGVPIAAKRSARSR